MIKMEEFIYNFEKEILLRTNIVGNMPIISLYLERTVA